MASAEKLLSTLSLGEGVKVRVVSREQMLRKDVKGAWDGSEVVVAAETALTRRALSETLVHEILGHIGLDALLGPRLAEAGSLFGEWLSDGSPEALKLKEELRSRGYDPDAMSSADLLHEAVAIGAERKFAGARPAWWTKLMDILRGLLAKLGFVRMGPDALGSLAASAAEAQRKAGAWAAKRGRTLQTRNGRLVGVDADGTVFPLPDILWSDSRASQAPEGWQAAASKVESLLGDLSVRSGAQLRDRLGEIPEGQAYGSGPFVDVHRPDGPTVRYSSLDYRPPRRTGKARHGARPAARHWARRWLTQQGLTAAETTSGQRYDFSDAAREASLAEKEGDEIVRGGARAFDLTVRRATGRAYSALPAPPWRNGTTISWGARRRASRGTSARR